jgi:hypothetical protein
MPRLRDIDKGELFGGKKKGPDKGPVLDIAALTEELEQLEKDMNELKSQYELYFIGVERVEPLPGRDNVRSRLRRFKEIQLNNTAIKFKYQMLQARLVSLETYWGRVARQREEGTYKRDVDRVKRREAELAAKAAKEGTPPPKTSADPRGATTAGPGVAGAPPAAAASQAPGTAAARGATLAPGAPPTARPTAAKNGDLDDGSLRQLYQTYVTAKRRCGEQVDLKFEEMASSLRKQVPKLMESTGAKAIEFKVVIKGGHAVLKAVPKT